MTYYNRDNLFNLQPIPKGQQGRQGATGAKGDEWTFGSSKDWLPGDVGYTNLPGLNGVTGITTLQKWYGGVLAPNGKIYGMPWSENSVLCIDPENDTYNTYNEGLIGITTRFKWAGGILAPNGYIYGIPDNYPSVLLFDPNLNKSYVNLPGLSLGGQGITYISGTNWAGGVLAPNGLIYCIPRSNPNILVIDPIGNTCYIPPGLTGVSLTSNSAYTGGVLGKNGIIYGIPWNSNNILWIDPIGQTFSQTIPGLTGLPSGGVKYSCGVLAPNGLIYGAPYGSGGTSVLVIDTDTNTYRTNIPGLTGLPNSDAKYNGAVLGPNGKIYCLPERETNVLIIDTITNTYNTSLISNLSNNFNTSQPRKCTGGVLSTNHSIYTIPHNANYILKIKTGLPRYTNWTWMLDPYFNKF